MPNNLLSPFPKEQTIEVLIKSLDEAQRRLHVAQEQREAAEADEAKAQVEIDSLVEALIEAANAGKVAP